MDDTLKGRALTTPERRLDDEEQIRDRHLREDGVYQYINHTGISKAWEISAEKLKTSPLLKENPKLEILARLAIDYYEDPFTAFIESSAAFMGMTKVALIKYEERLRAES